MQYADVEDGWNFHRTSQRFYRNALTQLQTAIKEWVRVSTAVDCTTPLAFAVNLGDLIDGKNKMVGTSQAAMDRAKAAWEPFQQRVGPVHHLVGNHELYNFPPHELERQLLLWDKGATPAYYDFTVHESAPRFRFVVLNCYGISSLGRAKDDPVAIEANRVLRLKNPNVNLNSPEGLAGLNERFVEFNGAVDAAQLAWFTQTLANAKAQHEHVVVFTHIPLHPATSFPSSILWNYEELLDVIYNAECVRAVFSGHSHLNGYRHERGVHFVVCDALLECAPHETAHAIVHVHDDRLVVEGTGKIPTRELHFPKGA